ncbi:MAG: hypothetical protein EAZ55_13465 [Cytophagales bacterium]|nr:MAG: hypothetical protein EAZ55_13465 [Cytophagales bacterium]
MQIPAENTILIDCTVSMINDYSFLIENEKDQWSFRYEYDIDTRVSISTWKGYVSHIEIVEVFKLLFGFAIKKQISTLAAISDISKFEGSFDSANEWLVSNYMPVLVQRGFKLMAFVRPKDFFASLALEDYKNLAQDKGMGYKEGYFNSVQQALEWVHQNL